MKRKAEKTLAGDVGTSLSRSPSKDGVSKAEDNESLRLFKTHFRYCFFPAAEDPIICESLYGSKQILTAIEEGLSHLLQSCVYGDESEGATEGEGEVKIESKTYGNKDEEKDGRLSGWQGERVFKEKHTLYDLDIVLSLLGVASGVACFWLPFDTTPGYQIFLLAAAYFIVNLISTAIDSVIASDLIAQVSVPQLRGGSSESAATPKSITLATQRAKDSRISFYSCLDTDTKKLRLAIAPDQGLKTSVRGAILSVRDSFRSSLESVRWHLSGRYRKNPVGTARLGTVGEGAGVPLLKPIEIDEVRPSSNAELTSKADVASKGVAGEEEIKPAVLYIVPEVASEEQRPQALAEALRGRVASYAVAFAKKFDGDSVSGRQATSSPSRAAVVLERDVGEYFDSNGALQLRTLSEDFKRLVLHFYGGNSICHSPTPATTAPL